MAIFISNIFFSSIDTLSNFFANRRIPYFIKETNQRLAGKWGNFWNLLATPGFDKYLFLTSDLNIINRKVGNTVFDIDSIGHESKSNDLSYDRNERIINLIAGLSFEKTYLKMLSDRYQKTAKIVAAAKYNIYDVRNRSDRNFQNFDRYFTLFSPEISFNYRNLQFGEFENVLDLKYNRSFDFPTTDQLFPVVDTIQIYSLYLGNPELKPSRKNEILLDFKQKRLNKNPFYYGLSTGMSMTKNYISYSMLFDSSGRTIIRPTNVDRNRSIIFRGNLARAIKFKKDQLQFKMEGYWSASEVPFYILYIAGQQSFEKSLNSSMGIEFNTLFSHLDIFYLGLNYSYKNLSSRQNNDSEKIKSEWHKIEGNTLINVSRRLSFISNFAYYDNKFYGDNQHYSIFNIKVSYRMLKKNNLEASLSGNDILNQNRLFTVKNIANTLSQQRTNAMGRFFMLSLAYYPRMFGKNSNK